MAHGERQRTGSVASVANAEILAAHENQPKSIGSWLERRLKPKKINARYPIKGKPLLFATCGFGSLGDALFGYNSGITLPVIDHLLWHADMDE